MKSVQTRTSSRRGAILSMELVLILPIFLLLIFSIVEFSMLMSAHTRVANAAQSGSRLMSISGASENEVKEKVASLLGPVLAENCQIQVEAAEHAGEIGRVTVHVPMKNASPDLLWIVGFDLESRSIDVDAPMVMERSASNEDLQRL
jgi:hypothetical protein